MKKNKIELVIEKGEDCLWGRVNYKNNLITDWAADISLLESNIKKLLIELESLEENAISFIYTYDVFALFQEFDFLNISKVVVHAGINSGLLRQYASGVKHPSLTQAKKIEQTIHHLAA